MRWPYVHHGTFDLLVAQERRLTADLMAERERVTDLLRTISDLRKSGAEPVSIRPEIPVKPRDLIAEAITTRAKRLPLAARTPAMQAMGQWALDQKRLGTDEQAILVGIEQGQEVTDGVPG